MRLLPAAVVALLLGLSSAAFAAEGVYRWVDAQGRVHFGDRSTAPPDARPLRPPAPVTVTADPLPEATAGDPAACEQARANLQSYLAAGRIVEQDTLGQERELDAQQRELLIRRAEVQVSRACSDRDDDDRFDGDFGE